MARNVMGDGVNVNSVTAKAKELLVRCARSEISDSERKDLVKTIDEIHVYRQEPLSENTLRRHLENINWLARLPDEAKGLRFRPFESPNKLASTIGRVSRKTKDITIEQSVEIIEYVISMVFTVAPKIIAALEANSVSRQAYDQMSDQSRAKLLRDVVLQVESLPYGIKLLETATATQSIAAREVTLHTLYLAALECIFMLVQICNGRRKNEIRGERGIEAGLYRGCVQTIDDDLNGFELDVYILKYNTGWRSLPANRLVHDATKIAEQLQSAYFGLSGMKPEDFGLEYGSRRASLSIIASSFMGDVRNQKTTLFRHDRITGFMESCLPTCDADILSKTHVYRRLFSNLYYHRFEDSRLIALMQQLQHLDLEQTRHYISKDAHWTQADKRVSKHRPAELKIDDASSFDYHKHHIERIFDGKPVGGGYALLVATLTKRLLKTAEFAGYSQKEKARIVAEKQASRGFSPDPKGHGICWVGSSRHTRKAAHCFNSETGNTEKSDASPSICHGCINFLSTPGHLEYQTGLLKELESEAANFGLPDSIRQQQKQHYDDLREVIWFEQESFGSNDAAIAKKIGDMVAAGENDQD
ncbi:hypothetical protein [Congregibacter litoralis]|uniref:hypothetical protein n=1 Tax=Congregibacter litoralis TaxID=393662 RepID=UPI001260348B|nr:hypothetical protein [Congregibacter litoralis]